MVHLVSKSFPIFGGFSGGEGIRSYLLVWRIGCQQACAQAEGVYHLVSLLVEVLFYPLLTGDGAHFDFGSVNIR